jgi:hypothetical protein
MKCCTPLLLLMMMMMMVTVLLLGDEFATSSANPAFRFIVAE